MPDTTRTLSRPFIAGCAFFALLAFHIQPAEAQTDASAAKLTVSTDFSGGSAVTEAVDQKKRLIRIRPAGEKKYGWVCWWYFKVDGIKPGETLTLDVGNGVWATPTRAHFSLDGKMWKQTPPGQRHKGRIVYTQKIDGRTAWFAWGPPFVPDDAERLVRSAAKKSRWAKRFTLCKTRGGRSTPALRVSQPGVPDEERYGIWIQARQHAWESGSSWVCKGFLDWIVSDEAEAIALRKKATITIVPIMDIDNVARGAGGKNQVPQDHNRDWSQEPRWRSVAAAQLEIKKLNADGRFDLFIDLHNPGAGVRNPYFYASPDELLRTPGQRNLKRFLADAKTEMTAPLAFKGHVQKSGRNYSKLWKHISKNWVMLNCKPHVVAVTLETAWNTKDSTPAGYEHVGCRLGHAIERFFRRNPRN